MKILHIASFSGNMGDILSHSGLYNWINHSEKSKFEIKQLEIRHTYLNWDGKRSWTWEKDFVNEANDSDLVLIGGGNYFEPWVISSSTGTTINVSKDMLRKVKTPIVILGIGLDFQQGAHPQCIAALKNFINDFLCDSKNKIFLRNDGSIEQAEQMQLPAEIFNLIGTIPDPAFGNKLTNILVDGNKHPTNIVINLAGDSNHRRNFDKRFGMSYEHFIDILIENIYEIESLKKVHLVSHTFEDLELLSKIVLSSPQHVVREKLILEPLSFDNYGLQAILDGYNSSNFAFVTRFHSVVACLITETPFIHINTHNKIEKLLKNLNLESNSVKKEILEKDKFVDLISNFSNVHITKQLKRIKEEKYLRGEKIISEMLHAI